GARRERLAYGAGRHAQQVVIFAAGHRLEPAAEAVTTRTAEDAFEAATPPQLADAPAMRDKQILELARANIRHDSIQALTIDVDDPQHVTQSVEWFFGQGFPHVALVELGVAHHRNEALRSALGAVIDEKARCEGTERCHDGAQSHRARGEIHDVRILAPARIRLQTTELAQRGQSRAVEPSS